MPPTGQKPRPSVGGDKVNPTKPPLAPKPDLSMNVQPITMYDDMNVCSR